MSEVNVANLSMMNEEMGGCRQMGGTMRFTSAGVV